MPFKAAAEKGIMGFSRLGGHEHFRDKHIPVPHFFALLFKYLLYFFKRPFNLLFLNDKGRGKP